MTSSVYLSRAEEHTLARLAAVNRLKPNTVLRLGLHELAGRADRAGRLPLVGRTAAVAGQRMALEDGGPAAPPLEQPGGS